MKFVPLKTAFLIIFLALIAGILYYIALLPQKPLTQINNTTVTKAATTLSIENTKKDKSGRYFSEVLINTNGNKVTSVQLELSLDSKLLKDFEVKSGNFFESGVEFIKKIDEKNGRITYALGAAAESEGVSGKAIVATIYYSSVTNKEIITAINFLPKTEVSAVTFSGSALSGTFDGLISIKALTPTKTASSSGNFVPPPGFNQ